MIVRILICGLLAAASGGPAPADDDQTQVAQSDGWERYEVLVKRNIFSRERGRPDPPVRGAVSTAPPPPERYLLLRGVLKQGEEWTAILEDARTGSVTKAHVGDGVLEGRVTGITMDSIDYEKDGRAAHVALGQNLEGGGSARTAGATSAPAAGAAAGAATGTAGQADILEQLRQRRQRELGQ